MRILQINCVYKYGSTGKIVYDLHSSYLNNGHDSYVIYGRGEKVCDKNVYKCSTEIEGKIHSVQSKLFGIDFGYSYFATQKCLRLIQKINPNVVHLHCLNGHFVNIYMLFDFLKKNHIKTILTLHAELMHTAGCEHAMECNKWIVGCYACNKIRGIISHFYRDDARYCYGLMKQTIQNFDELTVVGCSNWIGERARQSAIFKGHRFYTVTNGIDISAFHYTTSNSLRSRLGVSEQKKIILHVTPNFSQPFKGGHYLIEIAKKLPNYQFVVVGTSTESDTSNIMFVGRTNDKKELAKYYSMADCLAMTSTRENYPTVCIEAVACGLNVVGFDSGGISETIPANMGECVKAYDIDAFVQALITWCSKEKYTEGHIKTPEEMAREYLEVYEEQ